MVEIKESIVDDKEKKMEVYSWEDMDLFHRNIASQIKKSSFDPDVIVGIQRCGLVTAVHLAYILGIRDVESIQIISTADDSALSNRDVTPIVNFKPKVHLEKKRILLVDTVVDTGSSMNIALYHLRQHHVEEIRIATVSDWPHSNYKMLFGQERPRLDYVAIRSKYWPDFPWEH